MVHRKKVWVSWSTGKDSAYAFHLIRQNTDYEILGIFTTVNEDNERVAMHSTRQILLQRQAEELGVRLEIVNIPALCTNAIYENCMLPFLRRIKNEGALAVIFGDIFLREIRDYREHQLGTIGLMAEFPLWGIPSRELAGRILREGFGAILTCVDPKQIPPAFAGRDYDLVLLKELPQAADPCGENGEFHTFVYKSPDFAKALAIEVGGQVSRGGFTFSDVTLTPEPSPGAIDP